MRTAWEGGWRQTDFSPYGCPQTVRYTGPPLLLFFPMVSETENALVFFREL